MKLCKLVAALASCIALSSPVFAETAEERAIANCDWPETAAMVQPGPASDNRAAEQDRLDEIIANCDWPAEGTDSNAMAEEKGEADRSGESSARSDDELIASCDWPEAA